jgi:hypothetical protein
MCCFALHLFHKDAENIVGLKGTQRLVAPRNINIYIWCCSSVCWEGGRNQDAGRVGLFFHATDASRIHRSSLPPRFNYGEPHVCATAAEWGPTVPETEPNTPRKTQPFPWCGARANHHAVALEEKNEEKK